jgi:hypothetical protein
MRIYSILTVLIVFGIFSTGCTKENTIIKEEIHGLAQKGPFVIGSNISIFELNTDLTQTGKTYSTQISDNTGSFRVNSLELKSQFVEIKADGFYFNEVSGEKSTAPLTLFTLSDVTDKSNINTNVITSLEKERIKYLISQGNSFSNSKAKAKSEILKIFSITDSFTTESELLSIAGAGDENAVLLALSILLQGYGSVADLTELLSGISFDIKEDGKLDNMELGSKLLNNAKYLNLENIRNNIEKRYDDLNMSVDIPDFEKYINQFLENTTFSLTNIITYPLKNDDGNNILSDQVTTFSAGRYSISAFIPEGTSLKIVFGPVTGYGWSVLAERNPISGWELNNYGHPKEFILNAVGHSKIVEDFVLVLENSCSYWIDYYEYGSTTPTKRKIITW